MPIFAFQVIIPATSAIPADAVTNTWHFQGPSIPLTTDFDNVRDMLKDFYTTIPTGGGSALRTYYAPTIGPNATVKAYNVEDPPPRAPQYEGTFSFSGSATNALPRECAVVMSYQAARASGSPQSRRRNRVYLGPLGTSVNTSAGRPDAVFQVQVQRAAQTLKAASTASVNWDWVVWSKTNGTSYAVHDGWVDDAWDSQRRRGLAPTSRYTFS